MSYSTILVPFLHGRGFANAFAKRLPAQKRLVPFTLAKPLPQQKCLPQQRRGSANESTITTTLVIFDSQVADLPLLYNALLPGSIAHTLQPDRDSIDIITNLLTQIGATKLAIVAHGQPGAIQIGNGQIDRAMLETRSGLLQEWGLDSIELYSCEVGADAEFIKRFAELTGANISASTSKLGSGNWELDGGIELLEIDRLADYSGTLATFNGTAGSDAANAITNVLTGFIGGTLAELTDEIGDIFDGKDGDDYVNAGSGNDIINGGNGNDALYGNNGNDTLVGGDGINDLYGGAGDDRIVNYSMRGEVSGGTGNDFLQIDNALLPTDAYTVIFTEAARGKFFQYGTQVGTFTGIEQFSFNGWNGNDVIDASLANLNVTVPGTAAGYGTYGLEIYGQGGSDIVLGSAGNDSISGGDDNDYLLGQGGNDMMFGGAGFDIIYGGSGIDTIYGGGLNDTIFGGTGNDIIDGSIGEDYIYGEDDNDTINGGDGFDVIYGQAGNDILNGDGLNDTIFGGVGSDTINGGIGNDYLDGEGDEDFMHGNDGLDVIYGQAGGDFIYGDANNDYLVGGDDNDYLYGGDGIDYLEGDAGNDNLFGEAGDDALYGNDGLDNLSGGDGNDFLEAGIGDDILDGGIGNDVLLGGDGNDFLYGGFLTNVNSLDYLYGGNGNDTLAGGSGSDFLIGGAGSDTFTYYFMIDAADTITDFDPLAGGDKLDFSSLFSSLGIASSSVNTNYLKFTQSGTNAICQIDQDGIGAANFVTMATLNNVTASQLSIGTNVIV
jgi:Ca2+-binding RTX toxin-like protein